MGAKESTLSLRIVESLCWQHLWMSTVCFSKFRLLDQHSDNKKTGRLTRLTSTIFHKNSTVNKPQQSPKANKHMNSVIAAEHAPYQTESSATLSSQQTRIITEIAKIWMQCIKIPISLPLLHFITVPKLNERKLKKKKVRVKEMERQTERNQKSSSTNSLN